MNSVVEAIYEHSLKTPNKTAIIVDDTLTSYKELWNCICAYAAHLEKQGVKERDRVILEASHSVEFLACGYAIELLGATHVPVEANAPDSRINEIAEDITPKIIIKGAKPLCDVVDIHSAKDVSIPWTKPFPTPDLIAEIMYTTGTTGKSKGVMVTHYAQMNMCRTQNEVINFSLDNVWLIPTPMNHAAGLRKTHMSMVRGSSVLLLNGFTDLKRFFQVIHDYRVTSLYLPPSGVHYVLLLAAQKLKALDGQLDFIYSSSAAFPSGDKEKLIELLPSVRKFDAYGGSEVGAVCYIDYNAIRNMPGCVGKPNAGVEIYCVDENYQRFEATKDNPGIIAIKSNTVTAGYWNEPELTAKTIHDGVIYMSDLGYMKDGFLFLIGRRDDVINIGGYKVAPTEVEDVALRLPMIAECACVPYMDKINGQVLKMYVCIKDGYEFDPRDIASQLAGAVEAYKVPKYIERIAEIPKTFNGKIDRKKLIQQQS